MKASTVVGAVVGSLVGAVIWYFLETARPPRDATWAPLLIGVLAGLGSRVLGGNAPGSILKGALTAAVAIGAMVAARQGITYAITQQALQNQESILPETTEPDLAAVEGEVDDELAEDAEAQVDREPADKIPIPTAPSASQKVALRGSSGMFAAYFAVGALVAYFLGKGKGACCPPCTPGSTKTIEKPDNI